LCLFAGYRLSGRPLISIKQRRCFHRCQRRGPGVQPPQQTGWSTSLEDVKYCARGKRVGAGTKDMFAKQNLEENIVWWCLVMICIYFNCFGSSKRCKKQQLPTFYRIISTLQIVRLLYVVFVVPWTRTFPLYLCLTACILIVLTGCVCVLPFKGDGSPERIDNLSSWNSFKVSTCAIPSPQHSIVAPKRNPGWM
jgi:hypothetical protein